MNRGPSRIRGVPRGASLYTYTTQPVSRHATKCDSQWPIDLLSHQAISHKARCKSSHRQSSMGASRSVALDRRTLNAPRSHFVELPDSLICQRLLLSMSFDQVKSAQHVRQPLHSSCLQFDSFRISPTLISTLTTLICWPSTVNGKPAFLIRIYKRNEEPKVTLK